MGWMSKEFTLGISVSLPRSLNSSNIFVEIGYAITVKSGPTDPLRSDMLLK